MCEQDLGQMPCHLGFDHLEEQDILIYLRKVCIDMFELYLFDREYLHMLTVRVIRIGILSLVSDQVRIQKRDPVIVHVVPEPEIHEYRSRYQAVIVIRYRIHVILEQFGDTELHPDSPVKPLEILRPGNIALYEERRNYLDRLFVSGYIVGIAQKLIQERVVFSLLSCQIQELLFYLRIHYAELCRKVQNLDLKARQLTELLGVGDKEVVCFYVHDRARASAVVHTLEERNLARGIVRQTLVKIQKSPEYLKAPGIAFKQSIDLFRVPVYVIVIAVHKSLEV